MHPAAFDPIKAVELLKQRLTKHKEQQKRSDACRSDRADKTTKTTVVKKTTKKTTKKKKRRARAYADASDFMSAADVGLGVDAGGFTEDMLGGVMGL